jgi:hypothetical protein
MPDKVPCEQFGSERAREIDALIEAATGRPCPGRDAGRCPFEPESEAPHLRAVV